MSRTRKTLVTAAATAALSLQVGCCPGTCPPGSSQDGVFVHISSGPEEAHAVMMGLQMAKLMADDHPVLVYIDVKGIPIALQDAPALQVEPFGKLDAMFADLLAQDVVIYACPGCLKTHGKTAADLRAGVQVAEKEAFFDFTAGRILTLDY
jgi:predicted peroxiredoxin